MTPTAVAALRAVDDMAVEGYGDGDGEQNRIDAGGREVQYLRTAQDGVTSGLRPDCGLVM